MTARTFRRIFDYTELVRIKRPIRSNKQDLRDTPIYSIPEAARSLAMPPRTLTSWFSGRERIFTPAGDYQNYSLLSFKDVAESYVLYVLRNHHHYSSAEIKRAMVELRKETKSQHPLLSLDLRSLGKNLLLNRPARGSRGREVVNLSGFRNLVIGEVVDTWGQRLLQDEDGKTLAIFPWRYFDEDKDSRPVSMDPEVLSGRLVVTGTRIPVSALLGLRIARKSDAQIAKSYDLDVEVVKKALRHIDNPLPKVA